MRKINTVPYPTSTGSWDVRGSIIATLFNEKVDARELLRRDELARQIESQAGDSLLLEDADYAKVVSGLNATDLKPFGREVVEFVRRVLDAPTVEVQAK